MVTDVVCTVEGLSKLPKLGPCVGFCVVQGAMHDIFASEKKAREKAYLNVFKYFQWMLDPHIPQPIAGLPLGRSSPLITTPRGLNSALPPRLASTSHIPRTSSSTQLHIPRLSSAAQIPNRLSSAAQIPNRLSSAAQLPSGLSSKTKVN